MEEDDDDLDNQDELNEKIELSVSRFEEDSFSSDFCENI